MSPLHKRIRWLRAQVHSPPLSAEARRHAGYLLRTLQAGATIPMPDSRPMPSVGAGVHELRIRDASVDWRIIYRIDDDAIVVVDVLSEEDAADTEEDARLGPCAAEGVRQCLARNQSAFARPGGLKVTTATFSA
jgi:phage-related protein